MQLSSNSTSSTNSSSASSDWRRISLFVCLISALASFGTGCKTKAAHHSGFLDQSGKMTEQSHRFPVHRVWVKPGVNKDNYDKVIIAPVNTTYLMENTGWKAANPGNMKLEEAVHELADYTQNTF